MSSSEDERTIFCKFIYFYKFTKRTDKLKPLSDYELNLHPTWFLFKFVVGIL